ncbi:hypothetical protein DY000_02027203 [Brassica cretica]|uniref:Uncharacterized protein n=1 Tax=Brassica cretica TaxID=69181 RepID=A0ABQ7E6W2_BRACR|nr:hypothetical protein DY000_02027203 [Brassica cretica]
MAKPYSSSSSQTNLASCAVAAIFIVFLIIASVTVYLTVTARFLARHGIARMIDEWIMMHKNPHTDKWDSMN